MTNIEFCISALKNNGNLLNSVSECTHYAQFKWTPGNRFRISFSLNKFAACTHFIIKHNGISYAIGGKQCFGDFNEAVMYANLIQSLCKNSKSSKNGYLKRWSNYYNKLYIIDTLYNEIVGTLIIVENE